MWTVFNQSTGNPPAYIVEITGTDLLTPEVPRLVIFPTENATVTILDTKPTAIHAKVVPSNKGYVISDVALSYSNGTKSKPTATTNCSDESVVKDFFYVPSGQAKVKYGRGVGVNFDVIQISIVNKCSLPVLIPLAGIYLPAHDGSPNIYPISLDHVTSIYSHDRQMSGPRAIYFNIVQAAATLGSAIEPFFGPGFTTGVSIVGGAFTQGSGEIWKDLSAEQLQNLTSQSYQSTEQIGPNGGSLQKFVFLPKSYKGDTTVQNYFSPAAKQVTKKGVTPAVTPPAATGGGATPQLHLEIIPVLTAP